MSVTTSEARYALLEECWWVRCQQAGALRDASTTDEPVLVRLCPLHHDLAASLVEQPGVQVQIWHEADSGLPVVVAVRVASRG